MTDHVRGMEIPERLREPLRRALTGQDFPWPERLDAAEIEALVAHGVAPLAYAAVHVPALREEALRAAAAESLRLLDLRNVLAVLPPAIILKGTALAYDLYAAPELRPRSDTDLLIAAASLGATRGAFLRLGYSERLTSGDEHGVRQTAFSRVDMYGIEHVYDVHWAVANSAVFAGMLRFEELEPIPLPQIGAGAYTMRDAEALLLACVHRVAHHQDSEKLIWLVDIDLLRARMPREEHRRFWQLAARRRVVHVCMHSIATTDAWLGRAPSHEAREFIEVPEDEPSRVFLDRDIRYGALTFADLRALPWPARLQRLRQLAFPPRAFMEESFATRNRVALPWLYLYRGLRGVVRLFARAGTR
ncbi:MAG TPA: nucleotidyltransferase family protein [Thermoanaerobaculia bacterium]